MRRPHRHLWAAILLAACASEPGYQVPPQPPGTARDPLPVEPEYQVDVVLQVVEPAVDVLWVIDNSGSMDGDRAGLAEAFPAFVAPFVDTAVDFHIGVITMDMGRASHQGKLRTVGEARWLDRDTPDLERTFADMATAALAPDDAKPDLLDMMERGRDAILQALEFEARPGGYNEGFLRERDSAWLHITVVSDEDDHSTGTTVPEFVEWLRSVRSLPDRLTFNSVVALVSRDRAVRGDDYLAVTDAIGGQVDDLLDRSWPDLLGQLGVLQSPAPLTEFYLTKLPDPLTIQVRAVTSDGVTLLYEEGLDYVYEPLRNSVAFSEKEAPSPGARVEIRYRARRL